MPPLRSTLSAVLFASLVTATSASAQPTPTPPTIATFVHAAYPDAARTAGREASVELEITVGVDGLVVDARVLAPVGDGFDEAALVAVRQFVFAPATRDGHPIAARIRYRYAFTLDAPPVVVAPVPLLGRIEGRLLSRVDGKPLVGVEVVVTGADGGVQRVTTDETGTFAASELPAGHYHLAIDALDHAAFAQDEDVVAGEAAAVTYRLSPTAPREDAGAYGAVATIEAPVREITRRSIEAEEMTKIPGTRGDALRAVELLPGIARPPSGNGMIIVRGSAPDDSQVFLDGAPVSALYHFGGLTSFVNGSLLKRVDLYPGNFSTHYGRKIGGIVEAELRDPRTDGYHASVDLNMIDAMVLAEGPIGDKASFAIAGRRSYIDAWLGPLLRSSDANVVAAPVYTDWQAIATYKPDHANRLRLIGYGSSDELSLVLGVPGGATDHDRIGIANAMNRLRADWTRSWPGVEQVVSLTAGTFEHHAQFAGMVSGDVTGIEVFGRADWRATLSNKLRLAWGLDVENSFANIRYEGPAAGQQEGNPDKFPRADPMTNAHLDGKDGRWFRPAAYVEATVTPVAPLAITAGVRVDHFGEIAEWAVDPRATVRYALGATTLKGGIGRFSQPPAPTDSFAGLGNPALRAEHAVHYGLGVDHAVSERVSLGVEGYYKQLEDMIVGGSTGMLENAGHGRSYGVEVAGRWKPGGRVSGFLSYTLSRSERNDHGTWRLFDYDQTHILTVSSSVKLGHGWELGGTFRLVTGNPETPVVGSIFDADVDIYQPIFGATNSARTTAFHRLDVRVEKQFRLAGARCAGYLDLQNAYNRQNREATTYNFDYSQRHDTPGLPIIPSFGIKGEL
ncbi:MAG: TonB-dependent receptor [Proteobacteria bacterium]|nr:TonB-dependent receptor [Pseudomonadota bacterium]